MVPLRRVQEMGSPRGRRSFHQRERVLTDSLPQAHSWEIGAPDASWASIIDAANKMAQYLDPVDFYAHASLGYIQASQIPSVADVHLILLVIR